jgi:acyl-CoA thioester hydrolase
MPTTLTPIQIRFSDIDWMGHVNNAVYLSYIEKSRIDFFDQSEIKINWRQTGFILARTEINYKQPVLLNDTIYVKTWCTAIGNKSFTLNFEIIKKTETSQTIVADGITVLVCYNYALSQSEKIPDEWKNLLMSK